MDDNLIYNHTWELDYITGPRIAFDGLFPDKKPIISFDKSESTVVGNSGCNGYRADYKIDGNKISFGEAGPSTMMYCGDGEEVFRQTIVKVDNYEFDGEGRLLLKMGDIGMLRFKKSSSS